MSLRIYLASSWSNPFLTGLVATLNSRHLEGKYQVYDFRSGNNQLGWTDLDIGELVESPLGITPLAEEPGPANSCFMPDLVPGYGQASAAGLDVERWRKYLAAEDTRKTFQADWLAMEQADCCVLVLPCGRSAHLEAGFMAGQGKPVFTLALTPVEPELMALLLGPPSHLAGSMQQLFELLDACHTNVSLPPEQQPPSWQKTLCWAWLAERLAQQKNPEPNPAPHEPVPSPEPNAAPREAGTP